MTVATEPRRRARRTAILARSLRVVPSRIAGGRTLTAYLELGVVGGQGAVTVAVDLEWRRGELDVERAAFPPRGRTLELHSRTWRSSFPMVEMPCDWIGRCVAKQLPRVQAEDLALRLRDEGDAAMWAALEQLYAEHLV